MKYKKFKVLLRGLLHGDNIVPSDDETLLGLVEYSLNMISERAESLHLLTLNKAEIIQRMATGSSARFAILRGLSSPPLISTIVTGKQIGRASCRERVCQYV